MPPMDPAWLQLPERFTPARVTTSKALPPDTPVTLAQLEGPGCIRRIFAATVRRPTPAHQRQIILRMFWDGADTPAVEAPLGDFFGQLHGLPPYKLDSRYLTTQFHAGYTATFPMPFQHGARIEVEAGPSVEDAGILMQIDWHAYPPESPPTPLRFHAQFRREYPCEAYGRNYLLLDAVGRGRFLGFNYGVAVRDDRARWSHAGAENVYVTNDADAPEGSFAHLRGAGGEDTFGASYGGVLHRPSTHLDQGVPYYAQEDIGPALARHTLAAYRFFEADAIPFGRSIQVRFGSMANDICSTAYWYQEPPHRPFARMPAWDQLLPAAALPFDATVAPDPEPRWRLLGPFHPDHEAALDAAAESADAAQRFPETGYPSDSPWRRDGRDVARWAPAAYIHGFVDFTLAFRPIAAENSLTYPARRVGANLAACRRGRRRHGAGRMGQRPAAARRRQPVGVPGEARLFPQSRASPGAPGRLEPAAGQAGQPRRRDGRAGVGVLGLRAARHRRPRARDRAEYGARPLAVLPATLS